MNQLTTGVVTTYPDLGVSCYIIFLLFLLRNISRMLIWISKRSLILIRRDITLVLWQQYESCSFRLHDMLENGLPYILHAVGDGTLWCKTCNRGRFVYEYDSYVYFHRCLFLSWLLKTFIFFNLLSLPQASVFNCDFGERTRRSSSGLSSCSILITGSTWGTVSGYGRSRHPRLVWALGRYFQKKKNKLFNFIIFHFF